MFSYLFVGGRFDDEGGRPSGYIKKLFEAMLAINPNGILLNGGIFETLRSTVLDRYQVIFWMPDVPNDKEKLVSDIKKKNPHTLLVTSKNNRRRDLYSLNELVARALAVKANLFVELSGDNTIFSKLFDPLGNIYCETSSVECLAVTLMARTSELLSFTRMPCIECPEMEKDLNSINLEAIQPFLNLVRKYAEVFQGLIRPNSTRFLGNASFRCEHGFPSFKDEAGRVFVSQRNIDKTKIEVENFVPVSLKKLCVWYGGNKKPSVDTPIQLMLYRYYSEIRYIMHSHTYLKSTPSTGCIIPCGAVEEFYEIIKLMPARNSMSMKINLRGHGSLVMASSMMDFENLEYIARPLPERMF
jgi:hypothetical protein